MSERRLYRPRVVRHLMVVVPIDLAGARSALAEAGAATISMLRSAPDPGVPVPGLAWTMRETALHLAGALGSFTAAANGDAGAALGWGLRPAADAGQGRFLRRRQPSRLQASAEAHRGCVAQCAVYQRLRRF